MTQETVEHPGLSLDEFVAKAQLLVDQWNVAHAAEYKGRLVLEVSEPSPRDDSREAQLFADVGTPARPDRILLLAIHHDPQRGMVGCQLVLPHSRELTMNIDRFSYILEHFHPVCA